MQGHRAFLPLAVNTLLGAAIMMVALQFLGGYAYAQPPKPKP